MTVFLAGGSLISALGSDGATVAASLLNGRTGAGVLTLPEFGGREYRYFSAEGYGPTVSGPLLRPIEDCVRCALDAAALPPATYGRTAVFIGSSSLDVGASEREYRERLAQGDEGGPLLSGYGTLAQKVRARFGFGGADFTFNTACTSSANALIYAAEHVGSGLSDAAVVLGVELFNYLTLYGFHSLQLLSGTECRPFDAQRDGIVLGEAVAAIVLTRCNAPQARWQGVRLLGGANGCDPAGITCSADHSMAAVMQRAMRDAGMAPGARPALIKAHGTGSQSNDAAESAAMQHVFGPHPPAITGLKGALGHTLGASGVLELVALIEALRTGRVPATVGFRDIDPQLGCVPLTVPREFQGGTVMCNYFGFGGNNTSFLVEIA